MYSMGFVSILETSERHWYLRVHLQGFESPWNSLIWFSLSESLWFWLCNLSKPQVTVWSSYNTISISKMWLRFGFFMIPGKWLWLWKWSPLGSLFKSEYFYKLFGIFVKKLVLEILKYCLEKLGWCQFLSLYGKGTSCKYNKHLCNLKTFLTMLVYFYSHLLYLVNKKWKT